MWCGLRLTGVRALWFNRTMTRAFALVTALAATLALVAVAGAKSIDDGNDTNGRIDIKTAKFKRLDDGRYRWVVTFYEKVPSKGEVGNEQLNIWKKRPHVMEGCGGCFQEGPYKMQGPQTGKQPVFTGGEAEDPFKKTGTGTIKRDGKTLTFTLKPKAVGKPKDKLFWRIRTDYYGGEDECPGGPCEDHAPNGSKVVKEAL